MKLLNQSRLSRRNLIKKEILPLKKRWINNSIASLIQLTLISVLFSSCTTFKRVPLNKIESTKDLPYFCLNTSGRGRVEFNGRKNVFSYETLASLNNEKKLNYKFQLLFPFQSPLLWEVDFRKNKDVIEKSFSGNLIKV